LYICGLIRIKKKYFTMKKSLNLIVLLVISHLSFSQNALNFDGSNDYVQTTYPGVLGTTNRTFEAWIYLSATPTSNYCILDYGTDAVGSRNTFYVTSTRKLGFISGGTNANMGSTNTNVVPIGQWVHVAFVLNSGTGYVYVNGVQVGTGNLSTVNTPTPVTNLRIGQRVGGGSIPFRGVIDEVRIWNVARTQTEIASSMNSEFCSAPSSLKAYYKFNQGTAGGTNTTVTSATDDAGTNNGTLTNFSLSGSSSNWVTGKSIFPVTISNSFPITACGSYTLPDGSIVTTPGTYYDTVGSSTTCDTLESYVVSFTPAVIKNTITDSGCVSYTTSMGAVITSSGTYYDTVSTSTGCDTTVQYNIIISGSVDDSVYRVGGRMTAFDTWAAHQWVRCDSNFKPIAGATNRIYDATEAGDYAVIVTRGVCVDTSECINISLSSLDENISDKLIVYPNPASNFLTIKNIENNEILGLTIMDVSGKIVLEQTNQNNKNISIEGLENGVYFLLVNTTSGAAVKKFIKN
jgi:hypothetical protein